MSCTRYVELDPSDERVSKGTMSADELEGLDPETAIVLVYTAPGVVVVDRRTVREVNEGLIVVSREVNGKRVIAVGGGSEGPKEYVKLEGIRPGSVTVLNGPEANRFISKRP